MTEKTTQLTKNQLEELREEHKNRPRCVICLHVLFDCEIKRQQKVCECCVREAMEAEGFDWNEDRNFTDKLSSGQ